jgi:hypothetical protein
MECLQPLVRLCGTLNPGARRSSILLPTSLSGQNVPGACEPTAICVNKTHEAVFITSEDDVCCAIAAMAEVQRSSGA